ncbi:hypothetical protein ABZX28_19185 [Streptomyces rubiginosohelvolus]|uniref:hypothetical protein n=1 Tax=Streptomyces rubiginosohelvolus TaxID=67362 RepID=UPI0033BB598E
MNTNTHDRAYPNPPPTPTGPPADPHRDALLLAQHTPSPRRTRKNLTEAAR